MSDTETKLPFNKDMQRAVLGFILSDEKFFMQVRNQVKPTWFSEDLLCGRVYSILLKFFEKYKRHPSVKELKNCSEVLAETVANQKSICTQMDLCVLEKENFNLPFIRASLSDWLIAVTFRDKIDGAAKLYNSGKYDQCRSLFYDTYKETLDLQFDDIPQLSFDSFRTDFAAVVAQRDNALTTGLTALDMAILKGATTGGLLRGEVTLLIAPVNAGKTTTMITMVRHNLLRQKNVLYITHEGTPADIRDKLWCSLLGVTNMELYSMYSTEAGAAKIEKVLGLINKHLTYIPFNRAGMTIEDVEPIIRKAQEKKVAKDGRGYDLLVVDYPAKLWTKKASNGNLPRREVDRIVYEYYNQLSLEYGFHSVLAIQSNREGSKINNGTGQDRLLTKEDVAEAWGPVESSTNVITINRSPTAKAKNRLTFYVDKSRGNETGIAVVARSDFSRATTHADALGCVVYKGLASMEDKIDQLLTQYSQIDAGGFYGSGVIPEHMVTY